MRALFFPAVILTILAANCAPAADSKPASAAPRFDLGPVGDHPAVPQFTPAQLAYVQSWIRQKAPECPVEASAAVAQGFLEVLQLREPDQLDRLLSADFPARRFDSMLLRLAGTKLAAPGQAAGREKIAERRVAAVLAQDGHSSGEAQVQVAKIRDASDFQYRRLLEGRMEDDDLLLLLRKSSPSEGTSAPVASRAPKALTAAEIVSEFARHNQAGSAMLRFQAYTVEGRLTTSTGQVQQLMLFKMRPDRFRLVLRVGGLSRYILAADHDRFWQQGAGQPPQVAAGKDMGSRRYLAEFADPLFVRDGYAFELLPDGGAGQKKYYRIGVKRPDGSAYVAWIEHETFRQVGREEDNQSVARYSDFRDVAGVTFAFREEITDREGHKGVLELSRITPNPGLIEDFFHPAVEAGLDYFQIERFAAPALASADRTASNK